MFYANKEIESWAVSNNEDYNFASILFKDGKTITIPVWETKFITEEPTDLTWVRNERCNDIAKDILEVMLKYSCRFEDINFLLNKISESAKANLNAVYEKLTGENKLDFNFSHAQAILVNEEPSKLLDA